MDTDKQAPCHVADGPHIPLIFLMLSGEAGRVDVVEFARKVSGSGTGNPDSGTQAIAHAVVACKGFTLAGGGDTITVIEKFHVAGRIDCISTAGGAFLEYVEGKKLLALGNPPGNWCCSEVEYSHNGATGDSTCANHALATTRF